MKKNLTRSEFITAIFNELNNEEGGSKVSTAGIQDVLDALAEVCVTQLKSNGSIIVPGIARITLIQKKATPERQGINPFTKQQVTYKAKAASTAVKIKPVKALKDAATS